MTRGRAARSLALTAAVLVFASACGSGDDVSDDTQSATGRQAAADTDVACRTEGTPADPSAPADPQVAAEAISAFGFDLFSSVADAAGSGDNVIVSPASVGIALALLEPGAVNDACRQLRELLRIEDPEQFHASMTALEDQLEARAAPPAYNEGEDPGEVIVRIVNAAYLQKDYPFEPDYLGTVTAHYGAVLSAVDFAADPDAVAHEINRFVADATRDRIPEIVSDDVLSVDTVLALVNALYLNASWLDAFDRTLTEDGDFTRLDGRTLEVPMMHGRSGTSARGDGWVAATKPYVGGLSAQFILPDPGRFDEIAGRLDTVVAELNQEPAGGAELVVPRFETRFQQEIGTALKALGLTAPYEPGTLLGVAHDPRLVLDAALHETFMAMDEEGTEAAAATVLTAGIVSAPVDPPDPVPVTLDRPFFLRIVDTQTGAVLFLGQILDPTL